VTPEDKGRVSQSTTDNLRLIREAREERGKDAAWIACVGKKRMSRP